jgi:hypothetical protein
MALIFGQCTWAPWRGDPVFPPQALWSHGRCDINLVHTTSYFELDNNRVLNIEGQRRMPDSSQHGFMVSQLQFAIRGLPAAHTFTFTEMQGGLWPQLLNVMAAPPVLSHRIIDNMPWYGHDRDGFDFSTAL